MKKIIFLFLTALILCTSLAMSQGWPPVFINTTIGPNDHWFFAGTNNYFNAFNIGGTTGTNGYMIWNGVRYDNPFVDISNDFTFVWSSINFISNHYNEIGFVIAGGETNTGVNTLEIKALSDTNSSLTILHEKDGSKSTITIISEVPPPGITVTGKLDNVGLELFGITKLNFNYDTGLYISNIIPGEVLIGLNIPTGNFWTKSDEVTNAIPKDNSVTAAKIATGAVEFDELDKNIILPTNFNPLIYGNNIGITNLGNSLFVRGLLNIPFNFTLGPAQANKVIGLDGSGEIWQLKTSSQGDMLITAWAKTNPAGFFVDKSIYSLTAGTTRAIQGIVVNTNDRASDTIIIYKQPGAVGTYEHIPISTFGTGDMLESLYAKTNPSQYYVDKSIFALTSSWARTSTNATGILGRPAVTNGRVSTDPTVLTFDPIENRYEHRNLAALGGGDMLKSTYATSLLEPNKVNQIASDSITTANIVNGTILGEDIAPNTIPSSKLINILSNSSDFTFGDLEGPYGSINVYSLQGTKLNLKFSPKTPNDIISFAVDGSITSRLERAVSPIKIPHVLDIDTSTDSVSFGASNNYYYIHVNAKVTNWIVELPPFGAGAIYKLDVKYEDGIDFAWGGTLVSCTNLPVPPDMPVGLSSYIFEYIMGATNFIAHP